MIYGITLTEFVKIFFLISKTPHPTADAVTFPSRGRLKKSTAL